MNRHNFSNYLQTIQQIDQEHEAALRGFLAPAIIARHAFIEARLTHGADHILCLIKQGRYSEATTLMNDASWGADETTSVNTPLDEENVEAGSETSSSMQDQTTKR